MAKHEHDTRDAGQIGPLPVLFLVDDDPIALDLLERALSRRFGADYQVLKAISPEAGLSVLEQMAAADVEVAIIAADLIMPGIGGVEFLERAHAMHPGACRALLVDMDNRGTRIPFGELGSIRRATSLGQIDFTVLKGWVTPEEWLYPQVQQALADWTKSNRPHHEVMKVVGEQWSPRSHALRETLGRNTVPFGFYATDSEAGARLMSDHEVDPDRLPAVILHDGSVLHDPEPGEIAVALGVQTEPSSELYDLVVLGAGPAGLAAAVYGTSEGLNCLVIEPQAIGGQAGTSSMIRNYLGFPRGLSGGELTFRAWEQALLFGAQFLFLQQAAGLSVSGNELSIELSGGDRVRSRTAVVAVGVAYRRLRIAALDRLVGAGVYYGAAGVEAPAMSGEEVYVIGGANSAGQAALHLARYAANVHLVVRGSSLSSGMSDYLVTQVESTPNIHVLLQTRVVDGTGEFRLGSLILEELRTGARAEVPASAVFVLIGAEPHTGWLPDRVQRDNYGYVLTGRDISGQGWPLQRLPFPFETSMPGVFAAGDVRSGSVKRVASAVGDGSVAIRYVHEYLATLTDAASIS